MVLLLNIRDLMAPKEPDTSVHKHDFILFTVDDIY